MRAHGHPQVGLALVFTGGVAGTLARWAVGEVLPPWGAWPAATFCVNVVGAFALGVLFEALERPRPRLLLGTGFLGAFTTYSALAVETDLLVRGGDAWVALAYAVGSVVLGFLAAAAGIWAARSRRPG